MSTDGTTLGFIHLCTTKEILFCFPVSASLRVSLSTATSDLDTFSLREERKLLYSNLQAPHSYLTMSLGSPCSSIVSSRAALDTGLTCLSMSLFERAPRSSSANPKFVSKLYHSSRYDMQRNGIPGRTIGDT